MLFSQATCLHTFIPMPAGLYRVHSAFEHAINLEIPGRRELFSIVTAQKPLVPQGLKLDVLGLPWIAQGESAFYDGTRFSIGNLVIEIQFARVMDLHIEVEDGASPVITSTLSDMKAWFALERASLSPGVSLFNDPSWQAQLATRVIASEFDGVVESLLGRGPGLTPSGDDFICGWLWWWTRVNHRDRSKLLEAVRERWQTTTPISENFLRLMGAGFALEALKMAESQFAQGFAFMRLLSLIHISEPTRPY